MEGSQTPLRPNRVFVSVPGIFPSIRGGRSPKACCWSKDFSTAFTYGIHLKRTCGGFFSWLMVLNLGLKGLGLRA